MSTTTANLGLFKYNTATDGNIAFSIDTALNANWDILDTAVGTGGSPTTVVSGDTWYRQWSDGWKEQGGEVSLGETEIDWVQPLLTENGTLGGNTFACYMSPSPSYPAWKALDGNSSTFARIAGNANWSGQFTFYFPSALKVSRIIINGYSNEYYGGGNIYGSNDNENWTLLKEVATSSTANTDIYVNSGNFYKYHKITATQYQNSNYWGIYEITINAKVKTEVANSITFPVSFNNTNYSYTFACQDGGGMDAYVSNKTTTGMTLSNTNSGSASWTACGY